MDETTMRQYQEEERTLIANRFRSGYYRLEDLFKIMNIDVISHPEKVKQLRTELSDHYKNPVFKSCETMGQLVFECLAQVVGKRGS